MKPMAFEPFHGLIAAPFTPMHPDGTVNLAAIERQAAHLAANGVRGAFVCGTTGESLSLSVAERQQVAARWVACAGKELRVIVHTGHTSLPEAEALAAHAQRIGAAATAALAPCFFKPANAAALTDFCARLAAAAPALPFYYYHIPSMTGVGLPMAEFLAHAGGVIPNLAGVKFTHENLMDFAQAQEVADGRFDLLFGRDEMLLNSLPLGTRGAVGSTYNYSAPLYHRVIAAYNAGDMAAARRHQTEANRFISIMVRHGGLPAGKAIMGMAGVECGPVRLPLQALSPAQTGKLRAELEEAGFFQAIA